MERLTKRREDGTVMLAWECPEECEYSTCSMEEGITCGHECEAEVWCKLAYYEDLAEQGRLVELPCKVGDTVYRPVPKTYRTYTKSTVTEISITEEGISFNTDKGTDWRIDTIGRTIFLTQEEAEAKLKELESEGK